ncbi:MAG: alpha/beta fold hydrolase [Kiritimatiellae bacterium]|nr:alpha/beta fold hydrolase [Kiritimatiellia bacterium]
MKKIGLLVLAAAVCLGAHAERTELATKIEKGHRILSEDTWYGYHRTKFDFDGFTAWVVEPNAAPAQGAPWTWTMQWAEAYVDRTGVLDLLKEGWRHVTIELFATRMNGKGLETAAAYQKFLVDELGFAPQACLVGMSWGGFFSTRYANAHPANVRGIYLDAPLMTFAGFSDKDPKRIGPWAEQAPADGNWAVDTRMPVNMAEALAKTGIPVLLLYGGQDQTVPPAANCELFARRFKSAGGKIDVVNRPLFGHHPHGLDPNKTAQIVNFFKAK